MPQTLRSIVGQRSTPDVRLTWPIRALLVAFAVGGSCLYGASLSWTMPDWRAGDSAVWMALSAGLAWLIFIPALAFVTRRSLRCCLDASLLAMAVGEVVLIAGAGINALVLMRANPTVSIAVNSSIVALSNITMAAFLTVQLRRVQVPPRRTLLAWCFILNASGAVAFVAFHHFLLG
jgi:hypothetical protein